VSLIVIRLDWATRVPPTPYPPVRRITRKDSEPSVKLSAAAVTLNEPVLLLIVKVPWVAEKSEALVVLLLISQ